MFYFNDTATTEIYTLSLHDALPISGLTTQAADPYGATGGTAGTSATLAASAIPGASMGAQCLPVLTTTKTTSTPTVNNTHRSEEHTSELQSRQYLVCRLLLEQKNIK